MSKQKISPNKVRYLIFGYEKSLEKKENFDKRFIKLLKKEFGKTKWCVIEEKSFKIIYSSKWKKYR